MTRPLYRQVYESLKTKILNYTYTKGEQLPTDKELSKEYDVSMITIKNAMDLLKKDKLVSRKPRVGTIVLENDILTQIHQVTDKIPLIGLIHTEFNDYFGNEILKTIIEYSSKDFNIIFKLSDGDSKKEEELINQLIENGVQGIILLPASSEFFSGRFLELVSAHFPFVLIDRIMDKIPACNITIDNQSASIKLTEHLFNNGHKKIGIITANTNITTNQERIDGAISAHVKHNVSMKHSRILTNVASMVPNSNISQEEDLNNIREFLLREADITAIVAGEFAIAMLVKEAMKDLGKVLYKDYSVVCFDHSPMQDMTNPDIIIDHIKQDQEAIGKHAVDLMKEKIENNDLIKKVTVPYKLIKGSSVRNIKEYE